MAAHGVLGAALAAFGVVARCDASPPADVIAPDPGTQPRKISDGGDPATGRPEAAAALRAQADVRRALAVMEHYHAMSLEALRSNAGPDEINRGGLQPPGLDVSAESDGLPESADVHVESKILVIEPPLPTIGVDRPSTEPKCSEPEPKLKPIIKAKPKARLSRVPAAQVFRDLEDGGDICVPYVIVGGGTAAWSAVQAIRKRKPEASVLVVTEEKYYPYNRTPLSKELWSPDACGLFTSEAGTRNAVEYSYAALDAPVASTRPASSDSSDAEFDPPSKGREPNLKPTVSIVRGAAAVDMDLDKKTITLEGGRKVQYEKLLLATGGVPRAPGTVCGALDRNEIRANVSVVRTLNDFRELRDRLGAPGSSVAVIGGGFLGTELAVAMASEGRNVTLLCAEPGVLYKVLPRYLSEFLSRKLSTCGIDVIGSAIVTDARQVHENGQRTALSIGGGLEDTVLTPVDEVVVATGILPRVELAARAGLELDERNGGIVVNDQMMAEADVWAAGDVASFWDRSLGRRRVEHWVWPLLPTSNCGTILTTGT
jgi:NADPH-dependent 2,4-dienoyl-CoA reductase/sulfur reductase-like enzyme